MSVTLISKRSEEENAIPKVSLLQSCPLEKLILLQPTLSPGLLKRLFNLTLIGTPFYMQVSFLFLKIKVYKINPR